MSADDGVKLAKEEDDFAPTGDDEEDDGDDEDGAGEIAAGDASKKKKKNKSEYSTNLELRVARKLSKFKVFGVFFLDFLCKALFRPDSFTNAKLYHQSIRE
jgi:hypothetical protein